MTERKPPGMSFETWVDQQITQAQARGAFADLEGAGRPLRRREREQSSYEWALEWARRQQADPRDLLPPGMALRRERDELPERVAGLPSEAAVRAVVDDFNARVQAFWRRPQESRWAPVPGLADLDALLEHWRATRPPPPPPVEVPAAPPRRRWWHRRR
ncbi:DnaJ family domain-containing protein [Geodermatophilus sp. SYSU D01105]